MHHLDRRSTGPGHGSFTEAPDDKKRQEGMYMQRTRLLLSPKTPPHPTTATPTSTYTAEAPWLFVCLFRQPPYSATTTILSMSTTGTARSIYEGVGVGTDARSSLSHIAPRLHEAERRFLGLTPDPTYTTQSLICGGECLSARTQALGCSPHQKICTPDCMVNVKATNPCTTPKGIIDTLYTAESVMST